MAAASVQGEGPAHYRAAFCFSYGGDHEAFGMMDLAAGAQTVVHVNGVPVDVEGGRHAADYTITYT